MSAYESEDGQFFPVFSDGVTYCHNVGTPPGWMSGDFLKYSKSECCQSYAFEWDYEKCLMDVASSSHAFASNTWEYPTHPYYPNFKEKSCLNDGSQPDWMASKGDYFNQNDWQCCRMAQDGSECDRMAQDGSQ